MRIVEVRETPHGVDLALNNAVEALAIITQAVIDDGDGETPDSAPVVVESAGAVLIHCTTAVCIALADIARAIEQRPIQ